MIATATPAPTLTLPTESELRRLAGEAVFARGAAYCRQDAVLSLARRAGTIVAEVAGSRAEPYHVTLTAAADGRLRAACTCPFAVEAEAWCKHQVAAVLRALQQPANVDEQPALEALLAPLSAEQLRSLVAQWAGEDPDGYDRVRAFAARCANPDGSEASVEAVRDSVGRRVRRALHSLEGMRDSEAYWHVGEVAAQVAQMIEDARESLAAGECAVALATLDAVTREYVAGWTELDDSDGEMGALFHPLAHAWAEAALTAPLTAEGRRALAEQLREWSAELEEYGIEELGLAIAAMEEGWDAPHVARALSGEPVPPRSAEPDVEDADAEGHGWSVELAEVRLEVLERAGRLDDALLLARASGLHGRAADLLLTLGRVDEALETALEHRPPRAETLALARRLWEGGDQDRALTLGEAALESAGDADATLAAWVRDRAEEAGRPDLALRAAVPAFRAAPGVDAWAALARLSGERWPARREKLLAWLRGSGAGRTSGGIDVLLGEERFAEALDAVEDSADYPLAERVADAAVEHLPERVIPLARKHAERIMNAAQANAYEAAAHWLRRARRAYAATGRADEWNAYLARIITRHHKKYRLRPLLEKLGRLE